MNSDAKPSREFWVARADHARGRRPVQVGDVLQVGRDGPKAVVVHVSRQADVGLWGRINVGTAVLEWDIEGVGRRSERRLDTLCKLALVGVGAPVDDSATARHRQGIRDVCVGDVLAEANREVLVVAIEGDRARLNWIETGRTSHRSVDSLRGLVLVRESD